MQPTLSNPARTPPSQLAQAIAVAASAADSLGNMAAAAAPAPWLEMPSASVAPTSCGDFVMPTVSSQAAGFSEFNMADFELDELDDSDYHPHLGGMTPSRSDSEDNVSAAASLKTNDDQVAFVIGLLGSILLQLAELKRQPWDAWDPRMTRATYFHGPAPDLTGSRDMGLWNGAIGVSMRFAMVLERLGATYHHHHHHHPPAPASGAAESLLPPPPSLDRLSTTLMLLSTYLQLCELFGVILGRISSCLLDDEADMRLPRQQQQQPTHVSRQSFSSSSSVLAGAPPTNIQIVMMLQMAECQLRTVERLMGLPEEGRIWSGSNGEPDGGGRGVLDLEKSSDIVRAYLAQARPTFQALKQTHERIRGMLPEARRGIDNPPGGSKTAYS